MFDNDDYDYQDFNEELVKALDIQPGELYYYFENNCYKLSPFLILKEITNREDPYEIYCYQRYNLKNGKFEYKRYSELSDNISYSKICKDYFLSFQEEYSHTICKANGVICNKFENNYDYFISTNPIDSHEQKVWNFLIKKSFQCMFDDKRWRGNWKDSFSTIYLYKKHFLNHFVWKKFSMLYSVRLKIESSSKLQD